MSQFKGVSSRFHLDLLGDDGHSTSRVYVEIGLDGLVFLTPDGSRTLRKYALNNISRWALRGRKLVLYTKSPGDLEENTVILQGDEDTTRSVLDTLTCSCMQMVELLQSRESSGDTVQATNSLSNLLAGGSKKQQALPTVDEVSFWHNPEKTGFMFSQGEHIKNWRRRWFILKQGYLFRFASADVSASTKPRGVVDLSKVTDVNSGREVTGRNNSIRLSTSGATVCYICDSETEQVEWMSALEGAVAKIVKQVAGVEDEPAPAPRQVPRQEDWVNQHIRSSSSSKKEPSESRRNMSDRADRHTMVSITGYDDSAATPSTRPTRTYPDDTAGYGSLGYGNIAGIAGIADSGPPARQDYSAYAQPDKGHQPPSYGTVEYPAYPSLVPQPASQPGPALHDAPGYGYAPPQQHDAYAHFQQQPAMQHHQPPHQQPSEQVPSLSGVSTGTTAWDSPGYQQQSYLEASGGGAWQTHYAPDGRPYYHNATTGATQWDAPAGIA